MHTPLLLAPSLALGLVRPARPGLRVGSALLTPDRTPRAGHERSKTVSEENEPEVAEDETAESADETTEDDAADE